MSEELHNLYQEIILDHNKRPRHYGALVGATHRAEGYNPLCGDKVSVFVQIQSERIVGLQFQCASCAICKASASIMMEALQGQSIAQADALLEKAERLLMSDTCVNEDSDSEMAALSGVRKFPARIKCATLPWDTFVNALRGERTSRNLDDSKGNSL